MIAGVAPCRSESVAASSAPALPTGQLDMFGAVVPPSVYVDGLRYHRARLAQDGRTWPYLRPYLVAVVRRFELLCAGVSESEVGPWPEYPDQVTQAALSRVQLVSSAGVVTPAEVSRVGLYGSSRD